jgi:hypothetical protein
MDSPVTTGDQAKPNLSTALVPALERVGPSILLFGGVFLTLTLLITGFLQPDRFPVHVGGKVIRLSDLAEEEKRLQDEHNALTLRRDELLQSQNTAPVLSQVYERRASMLPIGAVLLHVESLRASFRTSRIDPIAIPGVVFDGAAGTLVLTGMVTDATGGSNHILASFVDGLRALPALSSVSEPEYIQEQTLNGLRTPFTITIRFTDAA